MYELTRLMQDLRELAADYARAVVAPFTIGGKLDRGTGNAVGKTPPGGGGTGHDQGAEPPLGNPPALGYLLTSTVDGARSWVPPLAGAGITLSVNPTTGAITISVTSAIQTLVWGGDDLVWGGASLTWGEA